MDVKGRRETALRRKEQKTSKKKNVKRHARWTKKKQKGTSDEKGIKKGEIRLMRGIKKGGEGNFEEG